MIIGSRPVLKIGGRDERLGGSSPSASANGSRRANRKARLYYTFAKLICKSSP